MNGIIFLNGEYNYSKDYIYKYINENDMIFCADGGANYTYEYNIIPNYIIGDLDSIDKTVLNFYEEKNVNILKYPKDKDFTDFELILLKIKELITTTNKNFNNIYVFGGAGKRIDMTLNNFNLMEEYENLTFLTKSEIIFFKNSPFIIKNKIGYRFSIILIDDKIYNLSLKGFEYEVSNLNIDRKKSRLVSNIINNNCAKVNFDKGKILVILSKDYDN